MTTATLPCWHKPPAVFLSSVSLPSPLSRSFRTIYYFVFLLQTMNTFFTGGAYENRIRFPVEIVRRMRERLGPDFIIIFRLSMLDLVKDGSSWEEVVEVRA